MSLDPFAQQQDFDEPPPSSQTPVVFETAVGPASRESVPSSRRARPSLLLRLAPLAIVPLLFGAIALLGGASLPPAAQDAHFALGVDAPRVEHAVEHATSISNSPQQDFSGLETLTPCPDGMALVVQGATKVCVDRWEASLVEVLPNGEEKSHSPYVTPMIWAGQRVKAVSKPGVVPQAYVSRYQAQIACKAAGKRLCSANEWRAACEGPAKTTYPYGEKHQSKACNTKGKNPMSMLVGGGGAYLWGTAMHHPLLNTFPHTLAKTGEYDQCTNEFGVYDMVGNLHEWTSDGAFRGGYYRDESVNGPGCRYQTTAHGGTYSDYSTGFRCCADPR